MHVNNYTIPSPPQDLLDQCHQVLIGDPAFHIKKMRNWCIENELSLVYWELVPVMDVSNQFDECAAFYFIEAKDATAFTLKFK
jgi:hypothetical protein